MAPRQTLQLENFFQTKQNNSIETKWQGDEISDYKEDHLLRIMYHNVNGLSTKGAEGFDMFIHEQAQLQIDVQGISEHCLDTTKFQVLHTLQEIARRQFPGQSMIQMNSSTTPALNVYKPGGTGIIMLGNSTSRLEPNGRGGDSMGRWSYIHLRRKDSAPVTIISAYQVCPRPTNIIGNTAYHQQSRALIAEGRSTLSPRTAFIQDLRDFITDLQHKGHDIILGGDFNEALEDKHSGILRLITQTNLTDPFLIKFPHHQTFGTHSLGQRRIDSVYVTPQLLPHLTRIGYAPYQYSNNSDHRALVIELDTRPLFGTAKTSATPSSSRILHTRDNKNVARFVAKWYDTLASNQAFSIQQDIDEDRATPTDVETLDELIGQSSDDAERSCKRRRPEFYSSTIVQQRLRVSILRGHYQAQKQGKDRTTQLRTKMQRLGVEVHLPPTQYLTIQALKQANQTLRQISKDNTAIRHAELEAKIESATTQGMNQRAKALRSIMKVEMNRKTYHTLRAIRQSGTDNHRIDRVEIPNSWPPPNHPIQSLDSLEDPKHCTEWRTESDPSHVEYYLLLRNRLHFGQASGTPFTIPPLELDIDWAASTEAAEAILAGHYNKQIQVPNCDDLIRKCKAITELDNLPCTITTEEFCGKIKSWRESTTTSPSGRHLGRYKALYTPIRQDEEEVAEGEITIKDKQKAIASLLLSVINYCLRNSYALNRWKTVINMMIFKDPGNFKIHRLRVIHLYEADFNLILAVKWRQLLRAADNKDLINAGQYGGRPGCEAQSLTLLEELKYDLTYMTRRTLFNFDNDASSCYDRIVVPFASLINRKYGLHRNVVTVHANTLQTARFHLKTGSGVSESSYSHGTTFPIHGTGQGSGNSPCIWLFISSTLFDIHFSQAQGARFISPDGQYTTSLSMVGFVDDSTGTCNDFRPQTQASLADLISKMETDAQLWNNLLHCTGGKLELPKCSFHVLHFQFRPNGQPIVCLQKYDEAIHVLDIESQTRIPIPSKRAFEAHKTLGHYKAPHSNLKTELQNVQKKAQRLALLISVSPITRQGAFLAYRTVYLPSICYTLPQSFFSKKMLEKAQQTSIGMLISKCGYNRNTARALLFAPPEFAGGGFLPWYILQGEGQTQHFIKHWRTKTIISQTLKVAMSWAQWQSGHHTSILEDVQTPLQYLECRWIKSLRDFLNTINAKLYVDIPLVAPPERVGDLHIMSYAISSGIFNAQDLAILNYCRLYLHVTTVSELFDATGSCIEPHLYKCHREPWFNPGTYITLQQRPSEYQIRTKWQRLCRQWCTSTGQLAASMSFGKWKTSSDKLRRRRPTYLEPKKDPVIYHWTTNCYWKYEKISQDNDSYQPVQATTWVPTSTCIPVKVHIRLDGTITLTHQPKRVPGKLPTIPRPHKTFQSYISSLPAWEKWLLEGITMHHHPYEIMHLLSKMDPTKSALLVSDGSQKGNQITYGWVFGTSEHVVYAEHSGSGHGEPTSHRAECWGMLSGVLFLHHLHLYTQLEITTGRNGPSIEIFTDNQGLVTRITQRQQYKDPYPNSTLLPDWDLVEQIHETLQKVHTENISINWVKGHQNPEQKDITIEALYNIRADYLAGIVAPEPPLRSPLRLPAGRCYLEIGTKTITSHYCTAIRQAYALPDYHNYLERRHNWRQGLCEQIDWRSFNRATRQLQGSSIQLLKLVHHKLPTNSELAKSNSHQSPTCHYCPERETFFHLCKCTNPISTDFRQTLIDVIHDYMVHKAAPELIHNTFLQYLNQILNHHEDNLPKHTNPDAQQCLQDQHEMGPKAILSGFLTKRWQQIYEKYNKLYNPDAEASSDEFFSSLIALMWRTQLKFWEQHVQYIHKELPQKQGFHTDRALEYRTRIRLLHSKRDECLHAHRDLLFYPEVETYLLQATTTQMRQYLNDYEAVILESIKQQQRLKMRSIFSFPGFLRTPFSRLRIPPLPQGPTREPSTTTRTQPTNTRGTISHRNHTRWKSTISTLQNISNFFLPKPP